MGEFVEFAAETWYLFLAALVILGWLIGAEVLQKIRGIKTVTPAQALQLINHEDAVVLDIRDSGDYKGGHILAARHMPMNTLANRLTELTKLRDKPIIVYDRPGTSAANACALLKKNGLEKIHYLSGGLPAWQNANLPISKK
jgi:rhodanese-related sulfurtransferase